MPPQEPVRRDELDHLEQRVTHLEDRVESESGLRAMMDLDQSRIMARLDAQDRLLQALADTQSDHTASLSHHTAILSDHTAVLSDHTARLIRLEDGQQQLAQSVGTIEAGIETILVLLRNIE
jgi:chromosome segregation ATPase